MERKNDRVRSRLFKLLHEFMVGKEEWEWILFERGRVRERKKWERRGERETVVKERRNDGIKRWLKRGEEFNVPILKEVHFALKILLSLTTNEHWSELGMLMLLSVTSFLSILSPSLLSSFLSLHLFSPQQVYPLVIIRNHWDDRF